MKKITLNLLFLVSSAYAMDNKKKPQLIEVAIKETVVEQYTLRDGNQLIIETTPILPVPKQSKEDEENSNFVAISPPWLCYGVYGDEDYVPHNLRSSGY